mgnify:CR=1 FL=1
MKMMLIAAAVAVTLVAGCNDDEEDVAASSCTMEELQAKAMEVAQGLQANPSMAQEMVESMQDLAPQMQAAASAGEVDGETLNGLCSAYDALIAKF